MQIDVRTDRQADRAHKVHNTENAEPTGIFLNPTKATYTLEI